MKTTKKGWKNKHQINIENFLMKKSTYKDIYQ